MGALDLAMNIPGASDTKVKASLSDTKSATLIDKLTSSDGSISISISNPGGIEQINITQTGGPIAVTSVFGRAGVVVAVSGDYSSDLVSYDNTISGLAATDVKAAIDEIAASGTGGIYGGSGSLSGNTVVAMSTDRLQFDSTGQIGLLTIDTVNDFIGIGEASPSARLGIKGTGTTLGSFGLQIHNATGFNNAFVVRDDGRIGAGTANPGARFDLASDSDAYLRVISNSAPNPAQIETSASGIRGMLESVIIGGARVRVGSVSNSTFALMTNDIDRVTIDTSGKVGIGTNTPSNTLEINVDQNADTRVQITNGDAGASARSIFAATNDGGSNIIFGIGSTTYAGAVGFTSDGGYLQNSMLITNGGTFNSDFNIGTRDPSGEIRIFTGSQNFNIANRTLVLKANNNVHIPNGDSIFGADTTPTARVEIVGVGTTSGTIALDVKNSAGGSILLARNDNGVAINGAVGLSSSVKLAVAGRTSFEGIVLLNTQVMRFADSGTTINQLSTSAVLAITADNGLQINTRPVSGQELALDIAKNGDIGFFGVAPVDQQADPGAAAGTDAVIIDSIVTGLKNLGLFV